MREILALYLRKVIENLPCSSDLSPSQQSSSSGDLLPEMMESDTPSPASPPNRADDSEVSSRGAPPDRQVVQETKKALPEGGASVTQGSGIKHDGPELSGL